MTGSLLQRRLLVVTGKGGVGKSTVAAALAVQLARSGRRTLLCEVNAGDRLAPLLGHAPVGPTITEVEPNLRVVDLRPAESMREYVLLKIRLERVYRAVFENRMVRYFLRFIPSLAETVMLGKVLWHVRQPPGSPDDFQSVVIDAPATGHALTFLGVPRALLTTLPTGPMAAEARWMQELLVDPAVTGVVLVSLPEELPVHETMELGEALGTGLGLPAGRGGAEPGRAQPLRGAGPRGARRPPGTDGAGRRLRGGRGPHHRGRAAAGGDGASAAAPAAPQRPGAGAAARWRRWATRWCGSWRPHEPLALARRGAPAAARAGLRRRRRGGQDHPLRGAGAPGRGDGAEHAGVHHRPGAAAGRSALGMRWLGNAPTEVRREVLREAGLDARAHRCRR